MTKYVELKTAIDTVNDVYYDTPDINLSADKLEAALLGLPSADVVPVVHGLWIEYQIPHVICCSNCDWATDAAEKNFQYCPKCGARMDGDSNAFD